jgi:hypothetical protein
MNVNLRRVVLVGLVFGMIVSFLFTQPGVRYVTLQSMGYVYSFLPEKAGELLHSQTLLTLVFFWSMIFVGFAIWLINGDFFRAEPEPRQSRFELIDEDDKLDRDDQE